MFLFYQALNIFMLRFSPASRAYNQGEFMLNMHQVYFQ
jgi:hypothetical protein